MSTEQICDDMASAIGLFVAESMEMAEENWCPAQVVMLKRLFAAVLTDRDYSEIEEEQNGD